VGWTYSQLVVLAIAAMFAPGTLTFDTLALVLGDRPLRTGLWFFVGGLAAMVAIGLAAAFVLGNVAASRNSSPKTWVAIVDIVAAIALVVYIIIWLRRPGSSTWMQNAVQKMEGIATAPALAIVGAGALLAIPGVFIPLALKAISETDPSDAGYIFEWLAFTIVAMLPLVVALILLAVKHDWTAGKLNLAHGWLDRHLRTVVAVLGFLLAASLLRDAIAGLLA
jgi:hypothetical protein